MRIFLYICLLLSFTSSFAEEKPLILVTVAPQKFIVQAIAKDLVDVMTIVPQDSSPHTYEPTPKQNIRLRKGCIWFRIGEPFELSCVKSLGTKHPCKIIDLRDTILDLAINHSCCSHSKFAVDTHIWMTPELINIQAQCITNALISILPENELYFLNNLSVLQEQLHATDNEIKEILSNKRISSILVSHPAYAYFCNAYGLTQLAIEHNATEPTLKNLSKIISQAKQADIKVLFLQKQDGTISGEAISKLLNTQISLLDPYEEDVLTNLTNIAKAFALS